MTTTPALPLVLLPGLLCDGRLWATQAAELAATRAVHIPDLTRDASIAAMAQRVLAEAPPRFALGALSMGGYVAFEILRQAPERVVRLALFDTMASPDGEARAAQRRAMLELAERGRFLGISPQLLPRLIHASRLGTPVAETVVAMGKAVGREAFLRQQQAIIERPDSRPTLAQIQVPTLVVVGAQDQLTPPAEAELMHQGIQGSRLVVLDDCGHLPPLELPERTTALLLEWLV